MIRLSLGLDAYLLLHGQLAAVVPAIRAYSVHANARTAVAATPDSNDDGSKADSAKPAVSSPVEKSASNSEPVEKKPRSTTKRREKVESKKVAEPASPAAASDSGKASPNSESAPASSASASEGQEPKVSQRQPSQLKSSVRSLANKDGNENSGGGLSFASKKVADVDGAKGSKDKGKTTTTSATDDTSNNA